MTVRKKIVFALLLCGLARRCEADLAASSELSAGAQAYQEQRWMEAMDHFLRVLSKDPSNAQAHTYLNLLAEDLGSRQRNSVHDDRLAMLAGASQLLDASQSDSAPIQHALQEANATEAEHDREKRHAKCTMAQMEIQLGDFPKANDLVLQVIGENPNDGEAQRLLSDLQSRMRQSLDSQKNMAVLDRRVVEGFYAYGQADYASATAAWGQARVLLQQGMPRPEADRQVALLHFEPYEKVARAHLDADLEAGRIRVLFGDGIVAYEKEDFDKALDAFRQVALASPAYPQLGQYLVQSEAAVERKRTVDLTDDKRKQVARDFARGLANLEKENYVDAKASFEEVLALDPSHPQAKLYIQQIDAQKNRQVDPAAAEQHYEAGVIAYVSGNSEQAVREWHIAHHLDPDNSKIADAAHKVERELVLSKGLP